MKRRVDLYGECNVQGAPVDAFTAECCMHCINPECTRSSFGQSKFDVRVNTWEERLFKEVPRMDRGDPRYPDIANQRFLPINPTLTVNSAWVDPRDLAEPAPKAVDPAPVMPPPEPKVETQKAPEAAAPAEPPPPSEEIVAAKRQIRRAAAPNLAYTNTPVQSGQMIPHGNQPDKPAASSWDAKPPTTDTAGVTVVKRGAKIQIG